MKILVHFAFSHRQQLLGLHVAILQACDEGVEIVVFGRQRVRLLAVGLHKLCDFAVQIVVFLGGVQHKEDHLGLLVLLKCLEDVLEMHAVDQTVALGDSENCPFEPHFLCRIDDAGLEAHLGDILHEDVAKLIDARLGVSEESSTEAGLSTLDNGHVLAIVINFLL